MSARIEAIASATGMKGIFRLIAADVFEVQSLERVEGFLAAAAPRLRPRRRRWPDIARKCAGCSGSRSASTARAISRRCCSAALEALEEYFTFRHTSVLLYDEPCGKLVTLASRGYGESGIGAEVASARV